MEVTIWLVEVPMSTSSLDHLVGAGEHPRVTTAILMCSH